jgi:hypothetical protein
MNITNATPTTAMRGLGSYIARTSVTCLALLFCRLPRSYRKNLLANPLRVADAAANLPAAAWWLASPRYVQGGAAGSNPASVANEIDRWLALNERITTSVPSIKPLRNRNGGSVNLQKR